MATPLDWGRHLIRIYVAAHKLRSGAHATEIDSYPRNHGRWLQDTLAGFMLIFY